MVTYTRLIQDQAEQSLSRDRGGLLGGERLIFFFGVMITDKFPMLWWGALYICISWEALIGLSTLILKKKEGMKLGGVGVIEGREWRRI